MKSKEKTPYRDQIVLKSIRGILRIQSRWADWMERKTASISPRTWAVLLATFVLVAVSYNTWLICDSLFSTEKQVMRSAPDVEHSQGDHQPPKIMDSVPPKAQIPQINPH